MYKKIGPLMLVLFILFYAAGASTGIVTETNIPSIMLTAVLHVAGFVAVLAVASQSIPDPKKKKGDAVGDQ